MDVIKNIIENKKIIVAENKKINSLKKIKKEAIDYSSTTDKFRFQKELKKNNKTKLIAEYKPASPSQGNISSMKIEDVIPIYENSPVDMISVLTEESYFKSNLKNLSIANSLTSKPLLRKDFVVDEYMIYEAVLKEASCILLIAGVCPDIGEYLNITNELGIDAIVECHSLDDINKVIEFNPKIIGINNRNLSNFTIDLETTKKLKKYVPNYLVSESGVNNITDAKLLKNYGANAILIGTSILKNRNKEEIGDYIKQLHNVL